MSALDGQCASCAPGTATAAMAQTRPWTPRRACARCAPAYHPLSPVVTPATPDDHPEDDEPVPCTGPVSARLTGTFASHDYKVNQAWLDVAITARVLLAR
jgi:hypothetical protein